MAINLTPGMTLTGGFTFSNPTPAPPPPQTGQFVAVSNGGTNSVMTSSDGISWTSRTPLSQSWKAITYGNGNFVSVGFTDKVIYSTDGITWSTANASAAGQPWSGIAYGNGIYVAVAEQVGDGSNNRFMTSSNLTTWTGRTVAEDSWRAVCFGNGLFVAVSQSAYIRTSTDGVTWTSRIDPVTGYWKSITYGNGLFVAVGMDSNGNGVYMTSNDGISWSGGIVSTINELTSVTYGNGLYVAVSSFGTNRLMTSADGSTWTVRTLNSNEQKAWLGVTYNNGTFVAVGQEDISDGAGRVMTSTNGINWTIRTPASTEAAWSAVTFGG